jgi:hypothetical protein
MVRPLRSMLPALLVTIAIGATAADASAQDAAALARARERYREGVALEASGDYPRALEAFKDVALVKSNANVRFHIALCQEKSGDWVQAAGSYRLALAEATRDNVKEMDKAVKAALAALEPKIPQITVRRGEGAAVAEIALDGRPLGNASIGAAFPLNPGPHHLKATAPDREPLSLEFTLAEAEKKTLQVTLKAKPTPDPVPRAVAPDRPRPAPIVVKRGPSPVRTAGFVVGGMGLASLAASGVFFGLRAKAIGDLDAICGTDRQSCPASAKATRDSGATYATVSTATFIAGLGALGLGTILVIAAPRAKASPAAAVAVTPGGVMVDGRF